MKMKTNPSYDDIFDLRRIPKDILERNYVSYAAYIVNAGCDSRLVRLEDGSFLGEPSGYKADAEEAKRDITKVFPIDDIYQFQIVESYHKISVALLIASFKENEEIIIESMAQHNFFLSQKAKNTLSLDGKTWFSLRFEPIEQEDITETVRKENNVLYHISPVLNEQSILENGLRAFNNNPVYKYPNPRLYLIEQRASKKDITRLAKDLFRQAVQKKIENLSPKYTLFSIDLKKVPEYTRFFYDVNEEFGLFCHIGISNKALSVIDHITIQ